MTDSTGASTDLKQVIWRADPALLERLDQRRELSKVSRNEWLTRMVEFVLDYLPYDPDGNDGSLHKARAWATLGLSDRADAPDGHWHRRNPSPTRTTDNERIYGCQHDGCTWTVRVPLTQMQPTRIPSKG